MKLSILKKMALLLVGLSAVQGYAAADFYKVNQGGSSTQYRIESDNKCNTAGCIFVGDNNLFDIGEFSFDANTNELVIQDLNTSLADGPERVYTISAYGKDGKTSYWSSSKIDNQGYVTGDSHYDYGYFNKENGTPCTSTFLQSETFTVNESGRHVFDLTSFINELKEYNFGQVRLVLENLQFYDVNYSALKKYEKILKYESFYHRNGVTYGAFVDVEFPPFYFHVIQNRSFEVPENGSEKVSLTLWSSKAFSFQLEMKDRDDDDNHWAVVRSGNYSLSEVNRVITLSEEVSWKKEPGVKNYRWKINCDGVVYYSDVYSVYNELPMFRLIFLGFEGEELWSSSIIYGNNPARFAPSLTVKEDSEDFHYFVKWTPEIVPVTEDATYKAVLDSVKKDFNVYLAADYEAGGDISLSVENKTSCVSITNTYLDGFSYSSNSAVKLTGGAHTLRFDITLNTNGDCANDELAKTIKWTCADESELHFDGCTAIPVYVNGVKNERMLLSEHNDGVYNNGFEYNFTIDAGETATIQLAATYAVGGDVELVSTNAASCVSITKRLLNANCVSYDEDGLCQASEMFYQYTKGSWRLDQGPQDWPIGTGDVNLKVDKSYQLEYGLNFNPANCTEKEFVEAYALTSDKQNLPIYINGSKVGSRSQSSKYFNFTLGSLPQYSITFLDFDGKKISSKLAAAGEIPEAPSLSVKEDTEKYHYFVKWSPMIVPATEDASYKAVLDSTKILSIQLAATYAVGGDVELVSTNAASCVSVKKNILWANCNSFDESGNCKIGEMIYSYSTGSWLPMAGPQDWVSGSVDVDLKVDKSYQLSYTLVRDFSKCTEAEFVNALTLVTEQDEIPVYINGSKVGTVSTYSPYFNFTLKSQYSVTFFDDKGVQVGDVVTVASGMAVSAPAEPAKREGYTFAGWFQKDAESAYDFSAAVNEDLELYGKWTVNKYEIAVAANDSKMGSVKGAGTYEYGTEVELVATAAEGYKFSNWEDDAKAAATRKVVVKADAEYTANFSVIPSSSSVIPSVVEGSSSSEAATNSSSSRNDTENSSSSAKDDKSSSSSSAKSNSSSSVKQSSSSSKQESSSSAKPASSSSEIATNSSSSRNDTEKSSSSSAKPNSSSSVKSSSSGKTDAIFAATQAPKFSLSVAGRSVQIAGARIGSAYAILDMQGRVMTTGSVESANFSVALPRSGSYMVRVGSQIQRVNVR